MEQLIKECEEAMNKYGHMTFDQSLPYLQKAWWEIGERYGLTGVEVFSKYMDWKAKQLETTK